jgi:predicted component of type VI protein secretion system
MKFKLVIVAGEGLRNEVELTPPVVVGRSRSADVTIGQPLVSRRHCEITEGDENLLIVEDLGSLNGTFVGDTRITEPVYLEPGDYLTIGSITFQALYGDYTEPDFPHDSAGEITEEMPDFRPAAETPAEGEPSPQPAQSTPPASTPPASDADFDPDAFMTDEDEGGEGSQQGAGKDDLDDFFKKL